jgi:hypothetical protein
MDSKARALPARLSALATRAAGALLVAGLAGFVVLTALAAHAYPGGTYCEPDATSYRFWGNFFCDLTATVTGRGADNTRSAAFAEAAFASFAVAAAPFFWLLGRLSARRTVRFFGAVSAAATAALAWLPSRSDPNLHATFVFGATIPGLLAAGFGVDGLLRRRAGASGLRRVGLLGILTFAAGLLDAAGYTYALVTHARCVPWLPALQKIVALFLLAWMLGVAAVSAARTRSRADGEV